METQEYHVEGPVMIFLTTTAIDLDEELMNRCVALTVDEGCEQTQRIHALQRQARTLEGLIATEQRQAILRRHRNAQRLLKPYRIVNDYARELTFAAHSTRSRRDHEKYLTLIDAVTLTHQYQRQVEQQQIKGHQIDFIRTTLEDIEIANGLAPEALGRSLDELPPQTRRFWQLLQPKIKSESRQRKIEPCDYRFSRREVCGFTEYSLSQVKLHLERLQQVEYVAAYPGGLGKAFEYAALVDVEQPNDVPMIGVLDVRKLRGKGGVRCRPVGV